MARTGRILVADDEAGIRTLLARVLGRAGHDVFLAESGEEALTKSAEALPHVALLDMKMPGINGVEVLRRLKELDPSIQGIVITAHSTVESAVQAMKLGAFDYIRKPFDNDELLLTVERALDLVFLRREVTGLRRRLGEEQGIDAIIATNPNMRRILEDVKTVAQSRSTVLVCGESGTGKELVARAIHHHSPRQSCPFIKVNCAAISEELLESELFGHERGAFTGAIQRREGKFELAHTGTILLDEVSEMSPKLQAKLLRVLQERELDRVGGRHPIPVDVRVIATTNRDLQAEMAHGRFREDLFYRLNVVALNLPPLRERREDIPLLTQHFLARYSQETNRRFAGIEPAALETLCRCPWPGNVRQLQNAIERAVVLSRGDTIRLSDLPADITGRAEPPRAAGRDGVPIGLTVEEVERRLILGTLEAEGWNRTRAAQILGLSIRTIRNKLHQYTREGHVPRERITEGPEDP